MSCSRSIDDVGEWKRCRSAVSSNVVVVVVVVLVGDIDLDMGIVVRVVPVVPVVVPVLVIADVSSAVVVMALNGCISMLITELERSLSDIQLPYLLEDA